MSLQTGDTPSEKKDVLLTDIANADFSDLKGGIAWRLDDINEAVKQIREITDIYWDDYPNRVNLKRANCDLRDILSKLEEIQQYMMK